MGLVRVRKFFSRILVYLSSFLECDSVCQTCEVTSYNCSLCVYGLVTVYKQGVGSCDYSCPDATYNNSGVCSSKLQPIYSCLSLIERMLRPKLYHLHNRRPCWMLSMRSRLLLERIRNLLKYYSPIQTLKRRPIVCDFSCQTCSIVSSNCISCATNWVLYNSKCIRSCPVGFYNMNSTCIGKFQREYFV